MKPPSTMNDYLGRAVKGLIALIGAEDSTEGAMKAEQLNELVYQMLETERAGMRVYETALECAIHPDLKKEWTKYLEQTTTHEQLVLELMEKLELDPAAETPGRQVVRHIGESLVAAMKMAKSAAPPQAAQLVACECVVEAETKDHLNWELLHQASAHGPADRKKAMREAYEQVEEQEDEHLYLIFPRRR